MGSERVRYQVRSATSKHYGYAGRLYGGRVGYLLFSNSKESIERTGFPLVLVFEDGRSDGFYRHEVVAWEGE